MGSKPVAMAAMWNKSAAWILLYKDCGHPTDLSEPAQNVNESGVLVCSTLGQYKINRECKIWSTLTRLHEILCGLAHAAQQLSPLLGSFHLLASVLQIFVLDVVGWHRLQQDSHSWTPPPPLNRVQWWVVSVADWEECRGVESDFKYWLKKTITERDQAGKT